MGIINTLFNCKNIKLKIVLFVIICFSKQIFASNCHDKDVTSWSDCIGSIAINGEAYVGSFKNGLPHGKGTYTYSDGATYVGEFLNGKESGKGIFNCWVHGATYDGDFYNGKKHGFGIYYYPNGDTYEGEWLNGMKHGKGRYTYKDGNKFKEGLFKKDKFVK